MERDYYKSQLDIQESYLNKKDAANVFDYIKEISKLSNLKNESNGEQLLPKKFKKISFLRSDVALTKYLNPKSLKKVLMENTCLFSHLAVIIVNMLQLSGLWKIK